MKRKRSGEQRGFTLIELLVTISVLGIFLSSMYGILVATLRARESINNDYKAFDWGPVILDQIAEDLSHVYFYDLDGNVGLEGQDVRVKEKFEARISKSETNPKPEFRMTQSLSLGRQDRFEFGILSFVLVSDFEFRISCFLPNYCFLYAVFGS